MKEFKLLGSVLSKVHYRASNQKFLYERVSFFKFGKFHNKRKSR